MASTVIRETAYSQSCPIQVKLSVIIPAYNEAKRIAACLASVFQAIQANAQPDFTVEVIVADNNSSDGTADLARQAGARVVFEPINQISRARNAGAAAAIGDWLLFFDADTVLPAETLADMLTVIQSGKYVGGGTVIAFDHAPLGLRCLTALGNLLVRCFQWTPGCFIFCRADAFRTIGGFNQEIFAAEDVIFGRAMKHWGKKQGLRFAILHAHPPITSSRKIDLYGRRELVRLIVRCLLFPNRTIRDQKQLHVFYDGRR
jgi:glycosyltransferase involved in cell wall biosynthesis